MLWTGREKVSKKFQIVIPEKIRKEAGIKPGDKLIAISKHKILHYVPLKSIKEKGITPESTLKT